MNEITFSIADLLPSFDTLSTGDFATSEGVTLIFWAILTIVFSGFLFYLVYQYLKNTRKNTHFFTKLLESVDPEKLVEQREQLKENAKKDKELGNIWQEFDESLVRSVDGKRLSNTIDAEHFFNTHKLARGITESRLLAAVPGFLTAFGVIGTFTGLLLGLQGLELGGEDSTQIKEGITRLIQASSIAFMTSVWGVSYSVLFNIIEKTIESRIRKDISALQDSIDHLFPRIIPEKSLEEIAHYSKESDERLAGLAEKIGDQLQETMSNIGDRIGEKIENSLGEIMKPAIQDLVNAARDLNTRQVDGSQEALDKSIERFLEQFGSEGQKSREALDSTKEGVKEALDDWQSNMQTFAQNLSNNFDRMQDVDAERVKQQTLAQQGFLDQSQLVTAKNTEEVNLILKKVGELSQSISLTQEEMSRFVNELGLATKNMNQTSTSLEKAYENVAEVNSQLSEVTKETAESNRNVLDGSKGVLSSIENLTKDIRDTKDSFQKITSHMELVSSNAEKTYEHLDSHQQAYVKSLDNHIKEISTQLRELMEDFAQRVQDQTSNRLQAWDKETLNYTSAMTQAVQGIQEIVEEWEDHRENVT